MTKFLDYEDKITICGSLHFLSAIIAGILLAYLLGVIK
jgi:hypothetical protein